MKQINLDTIDEYHKFFFHLVNWREDIVFLGVPILKNPLDLWTIQELINKNSPNVIIETGTAWGGSALFYSTFLQAQKSKGIVISVDIGKPYYIPIEYKQPIADNIFYIIGDSSIQETKQRAVEIIARYVQEPRVMVLLDSNHSYEHVTKELYLWQNLVTLDQYLIVEDTNTKLVLPEDETCNAGQAAQDWEKQTSMFLLDNKCAKEKWGFSFNNYYKKIRD